MSADFPYWRVRRPNVESGTLHIQTVSEQEIEKNLPELPSHLEDGFSLKQAESSGNIGQSTPMPANFPLAPVFLWLIFVRMHRVLVEQT